MTELPSGTVTFLFTDIERSTESAAALGDERWAEALQTHRDLLRPAFEKHGGVEVGTEGDSFFVAFARAHDAVESAAEGQRALETYAWSGEMQLRVRMGLHTGEALVRGDGYVGHEVHRAKRISDAAHGGQILLSQTTADIVGTASLRDLGSHRLKDLGEPQRVYQLTGDGLEKDFPRLRSLDAFTHSLPLQRSAFIGREKEIAEIRELLETNRIVTLTGVGGCGKTRLALQVGAEELTHFSAGVFFVNLAQVSEPDLVPDEIAASVGVSTRVGLTAVGPAAGPADELLINHLAGRDCLILLDNCEHLIDACAEIVDRVLAQCAGVKILATSREALRVEGEQTWSIPSLSLPNELADAQASESVSLFKARAKAVRPGFDLSPDNLDSVVEICRRLDGIPLAIEFAAGRLGHLSPQQIAARLDDRFRLLTGGQRRVQRQQTLQAAIDWSFDLLDDEERTLLRRLSVFGGDFGIDAVEGICADDSLQSHRITDVLGSLVSKSLVDTQVLGDEVRYRLLETVRAYAAERLAHAQEADHFRTRHRDWYVSWLESIPQADRMFSLDISRRLMLDEPNLRMAFDWAAADERGDLMGRIAALTRTFFAGLTDRARWVVTALEVKDQLDPDDRLDLLVNASMWGLARAAAQIADIGDEELEGRRPEIRAWALANRATQMSIMAAFSGDEELKTKCHGVLADAERLTDGKRGEWRALMLWYRAQADMIFRRPREALWALEEALTMCAKAGNPDMASFYNFHVAPMAHLLGDDEAAVKAWAAFLSGFERVFGAGIDEIRLGTCAFYAPLTWLRAGSDEAWSYLAGARPTVVRSQNPRDTEDLIQACAIVLALDGEHDRAATLLSWVSKDVFGAGRWLPTGQHYLLYLHYRDFLRSKLGPEQAKVARERGSQMSFDEALTLAFAEKVTV